MNKLERITKDLIDECRGKHIADKVEIIYDNAHKYAMKECSDPSDWPKYSGALTGYMSAVCAVLIEDVHASEAVEKLVS